MIIQDPRLIPQSDMPLIVLSNNTKQEVSWLIDQRTNIPGLPPRDHAMLSINQGKFVWQSMGLWDAYKEAPMDPFLVDGGQLAFVQLVNNSPDFTKAFTKSVQKRLLAPPWQKTYDYLGVFGQLIGQNWIHTPGLEYCSVDVIRHLVNACPYLPKEDQLVINAIPRETNPEALWQIIVNNPNTFSIFGTWDYELNPVKIN